MTIRGHHARAALIALSAVFAFFADAEKEAEPSRNATLGAWGAVISWPHIAITAGTLPDGRIVTYSASEIDSFPGNREYTFSSVFDPDTETFSPVDSDFHDMFCAGVSTLEDGRIVASGGNPNDVRTSAFDPTALEWLPLADMNRTRWYGTNLTLPNNEIFSTFANTAGDTSERYNPGADDWTLTPGATMADLLVEQNAANGEPTVNNAANMQWWAQMAVAPGGDVFHGGPTPTWHMFDPYGAGGVTGLGQPTGTRTRQFGNVTTYDVGKVMLNGGYDRTVNPPVEDTVYLIDLNGPTPVVTQAAPMHEGRANSNTVMLPSGEPLVIGGNQTGRLFHDGESVFEPELYKPDTDEWVTLAPMTVPRNYHSIALLLRDGRVLAAGGGACGTGCSANHLDGEIFSPPYLFDPDGSLATRPVISSAPDDARAGDTLTVSASDGISKFSMVRLSATTHAINTDQRFVPVSFTPSGAGSYELTMQPNANVLIPGYYWLFAMSSTGTPSIGHVLQIRKPPITGSPGDVYVSDLPWLSETNGWGPAERDMSNGEQAAGDGQPITINGDTYAKGVGAHALSQIDVALDQSYDRFRATVGIDDEISVAGCGSGSVQFSVQADGLTLFTSPVLTAADFGVDVDVGIAGASTLSLIVTDAGDGISCDHADWANARLVPASGGDNSFSARFVDSNSSVTSLADTDALLASGGAGVELRAIDVVDHWDGSGNTGYFPNNQPFPWDNTFAMGVTGQIGILTGGTYTFGTNADDGLRLRVNGVDVIVDDSMHAPQDRFGTITLPSGAHDIDFVFFENGGGATVELFIAPGTHTEFSAAFELLTPLSDATVFDTDGDGYNDDVDEFPNDPLEWEDTDGDGFGDNGDAFPDDPNEWADSDNDGYGDNSDAFPNNPREWADANNDGIGDNVPTGPRAIASTTILAETVSGALRVWNVNPDNQTVTVLDAAGAKVDEIAVGLRPWSLAVAPGAGEVWVTNKGDDSITVVDANSRLVVDTIALPAGGAPHGIVIAPDSSQAFVVLEGLGEMHRIDVASRSQSGTVQLGYRPRHLTISADGLNLYATLFITPQLPGEATSLVMPDSTSGGRLLRIDANTLQVAATVYLEHLDRIPTETQGPGVPNYLHAPVVSLDGNTAYVPSKQDNILAGSSRDGTNLDFDHSVRAVTSVVDLLTGDELTTSRFDHDNSSIATGAALGPYGEKLFIALETSRHVVVVDVATGGELVRIDAGRSPQGLLLSPDGTLLYVHNYMERTVGVYDVASITQDVLLQATPLAATPLVTNELLSAQVLLGKQLFTDAADERLAASGYLSCASCHNEGDDDGRVWDFFQFGEGLRNTVSLIGKGGMDHGPLHWSANFDELQDFEGQIRSFALGTGLMSDADFNAGTTSDPLGDPKAGLSADLDALVAYISSLAEMPVNPTRAPGEPFSPAAIAGRALYIQHGCAGCHAEAVMTDSPNGGMHDVGTLTTASGNRLGGVLPGIDTPTLLGLWQSAPYLHDGSAASIADAIAAHTALAIDPANAASMADYLAELNAVDLSGPDSDNDGYPDGDDNCIGLANSDQADSDLDGYGDLCDKDLNNDCVVNAGDLGALRLLFFSTDPLADFNTDGVVNALDLGLMKQAFFGTPGPSSLTDVCF